MANRFNVPASRFERWINFRSNGGGSGHWLDEFDFVAAATVTELMCRVAVVHIHIGIWPLTPAKAREAVDIGSTSRRAGKQAFDRL